MIIRAQLGYSIGMDETRRVCIFYHEDMRKSIIFSVMHSVNNPFLDALYYLSPCYIGGDEVVRGISSRLTFI